MLRPVIEIQTNVLLLIVVITFWNAVDMVVVCDRGLLWMMTCSHREMGRESILINDLDTERKILGPQHGRSRGWYDIERFDRKDLHLVVVVVVLLLLEPTEVDLDMVGPPCCIKPCSKVWWRGTTDEFLPSSFEVFCSRFRFYEQSDVSACIRLVLYHSITPFAKSSVTAWKTNHAPEKD
jgi:hypothetical protein